MVWMTAADRRDVSTVGDHHLAALTYCKETRLIYTMPEADHSNVKPGMDAV